MFQIISSYMYIFFYFNKSLNQSNTYRFYSRESLIKFIVYILELIKNFISDLYLCQET